MLMWCQPSTGEGSLYSPDSHALLAGGNGALQLQGAAPTPGILQAAAGTQHALLLRVQWLDVLRTQVVPGPRLFILQHRES